jgi:flagellar biosynthesis/type III secretory pathway protein FliH
VIADQGLERGRASRSRRLLEWLGVATLLIGLVVVSSVATKQNWLRAVTGRIYSSSEYGSARQTAADVAYRASYQEAFSQSQASARTQGHGDGYAEGLRKGTEEGRKLGIERGVIAGKKDGYDAGYADGFAAGRGQGFATAKAASCAILPEALFCR